MDQAVNGTERASAVTRGPGVTACAAGLAVFGVVLGLAAPFINPETLAGSSWGPRAAAVVVAAVLGTAAWAVRGFLYRTLTSLPFAVALLAFVLAATMLGTFILQQLPPEAYAKKYGTSLAPALLALGLNDIFHSGWFTGWLALLAVSLVLVVIRKRAWRPVQWGHALAHLGVVLILTGCFVGVRWGLKSHIDLHQGQSADAAVVAPQTGALAKPQPLGFTIRLEDFNIEYYPPEPRFYVYDRTGDADEHFTPRKSIRQKDAASWTAIGASGTQFRVVGTIPASRQAAESHTLVVQKDEASPPEEIAVQPGETYLVAGGAWRIHVLAYYPECLIDLTTHTYSSRSQEPNNPALLVEVAPVGGGPAGKPRCLYARSPDFHHADGRDQVGPRLVYRYTPAEIPAQVEIEIRSAEGSGTHRFAEKDAEPLQLPDGRHVLTYEIKTEVKSYRSTLAVLVGERKVLEKTIEVNDPLSYGGYTFYQSSMKPTLSGLQVVRDPGLPLVWAGLVMMCVGVLFVYYIRPRLVGSRKEIPS